MRKALQLRSLLDKLYMQFEKLIRKSKYFTGTTHKKLQIVYADRASIL